MKSGRVESYNSGCDATRADRHTHTKKGPFPFIQSPGLSNKPSSTQQVKVHLPQFARVDFSKWTKDNSWSFTLSDGVKDALSRCVMLTKAWSCRSDRMASVRLSQEVLQPRK